MMNDTTIGVIANEAGGPKNAQPHVKQSGGSL